MDLTVTVFKMNSFTEEAYDSQVMGYDNSFVMAPTQRGIPNDDPDAIDYSSAFLSHNTGYGADLEPEFCFQYDPPLEAEPIVPQRHHDCIRLPVVEFNMRPQMRADSPYHPPFESSPRVTNSPRVFVLEQNAYPGIESQACLEQQNSDLQIVKTNLKPSTEALMGDTEHGSTTTSPPTTPSKSPGKKIGCPYFMKGPDHALKLSCNSKGFPNISRLKGHLKRVHNVEIPGRMKTWTDVEKWEAIWKQIFPEDPIKTIPSPYWSDSDDLRKQQNSRVLKTVEEFILRDMSARLSSSPSVTPQLLASQLQESFSTFRRTEGVGLLPQSVTEGDAGSPCDFF